MAAAPPDTYAARFEDGPLAQVGNSGTVFLPAAVYPWPLPDRLATLSHLDQTGNVAFWDADAPDPTLPEAILRSPNVVVYAKQEQSVLPQDVPGVMRGATYRVEVPS